MNPNQIIQMIMQLKGNPGAILGKFGVPANIMGNPQDVIQFLMNNGKITQSQYDDAYKQAKSMGFKI